MQETPRADRAALSREYSEFLIELSIALHKYGMYPSGHPSLLPAAQAVVARASVLLLDRAQLAFGIARRQLIIEGLATNAGQPVLRRLAESLHRHHLGAVTIQRDVTADEVGEALRALSIEPEQHGPLGLVPTDRAPSWPHLRLHPLSFGDLALVGDGHSNGEGEADSSTRGVELWIGLAQAAMAGGGGQARPDTEPAVVARAIDEHPPAEAYDQVIIGYLLQIARELRNSSGAETAALQKRTARLIAALSPQTLRRLVEMSGDATQRRQFVLDAAHGMAVDSVLDIVKAAAEASGQTISHGLVRMLSKLAAHAEFGREGIRPAADRALREQVGQLLEGWELADPNPDRYGRMLQHLATSTGATVGQDGGAELEHRPDPLHLVQISLESGDTGPMITRAVDRAIAGGRAATLLALASDTSGAETDAVRALAHRLGRVETVRALVERTPIDFDSLDRLLPALGIDGCEVLLDALAVADDRATRRKLLDRLADVPHDLEPRIAARLNDDRWFVQRNMLVLLERRGRFAGGISLAGPAAHPDVRVRHEAIRLQLSIAAERDAAVRAAIESAHPRLVHLGLAAIQDSCPGHLAPLVAAIAGDRAIEDSLRVLAARALGRCRDPRAAAALVALVDGGRSFLGRPRLAAPSPVMLAALEGLAAGGRADPRAAALLHLAAASSHADVRRAAGTAAS